MLFKALRFAINTGFRDIILEGDNLAVYSALKDNADELVNGGVIICDIISLPKLVSHVLFLLLKEMEIL